MSELPGRPDLDQLRRQARELLRAATDGEPGAVTRLRVVSDRVTLWAAQLAIAREYGFPSWPALKAEVERRRLSQPTASRGLRGSGEQGRLDAPEDRWSFGGATAIETSAGVLLPEALIVGPGYTALYGSLTPSGNGQTGAAGPRWLSAPLAMTGRWALRRQAQRARRKNADAAVAAMRALVRSLDEVTVVDDRGARYALRSEGMSGKSRRSGEPAEPMSVRFGIDPVPGRGVAWLELRSPGGAVTRLLPSARPAVAVGQLVPAAVSPAVRELLDQAVRLIELQLTNAGQAAEQSLRQHCSAALARTAEIERSGDLDPASVVPDQLRQLCAVLTEHHPAGGLPRSWSGMLDAARGADGPRHHLDIGAALPPIDGVAVHVDSLISWPGSWRLYLRATPGWWSYSQDGHRKWTPVSVYAEDDRGGTYVSGFGGSSGRPDHEELALRFLPRLDPLARAMKLTFRGASEEAAVDLALLPGAGPWPR
jgi:hypothetical protein